MKRLYVLPRFRGRGLCVRARTDGHASVVRWRIWYCVITGLWKVPNELLRSRRTTRQYYRMNGFKGHAFDIGPTIRGYGFNFSVSLKF